MIGKLRGKVSGFFLLLAKPFAALRIHPNIVSFLAIPLSLIAVYFILQQDYAPALLFAVLAVLMDAIDGKVAKLTGKTSNFGNYFETMIDKYVEVILIAPFALLYPLAAFLAIAFSLITSYAKPRVALVIIADNRDWPAIGEHGERLLLFLLALVLLSYNQNFALFGFNIMELILYVIAAVTLIGGVQRILYGKKLIEEAERKGTLLPYIKEKKGHEPVS